MNVPRRDLPTHGVDTWTSFKAELDALYAQDPIIFASLKGPLDAQAVAQAAHSAVLQLQCPLAGAPAGLWPRCRTTFTAGRWVLCTADRTRAPA